MIKTMVYSTSYGLKMCNKSCIDFGEKALKKIKIKDKKVLEVGSYDVNGSFRPI